MPTEPEERAAVIAEARSWLRTPYVPCADIKGVGVDCGMLLVRVFVDAGLCAPFDPRPYAKDWNLHRSEEKYLSFVADRVREISKPQPGDIVIYKYGRCYAHGGIITALDPFTIVHAYSRARMVLEEVISQNSDLCGDQRVPRYFSYWAGGVA